MVSASRVVLFLTMAVVALACVLSQQQGVEAVRALRAAPPREDTSAGVTAAAAAGTATKLVSPSSAAASSGSGRHLASSSWNEWEYGTLWDMLYWWKFYGGTEETWRSSGNSDRWGASFFFFVFFASEGEREKGEEKGDEPYFPAHFAPSPPSLSLNRHVVRRLVSFFARR